MFPIKEFGKRFNEVLEAMDGIFSECDPGDEILDTFEDLNAETEDALMMLDEINPRDEDWEEEAGDALDALESLCGDYSELAKNIPEIAAEVQRMKMTIDMARANLNG